MSAMNGAPPASGQLLRERVLAALEHFWCPAARGRRAAPYLEGIWHEPVATDALADLLATERQAFGQGAARPGVDLLWALARRARRARAGGRCRDWPLWVRVVDPD
jgi:hypothetical protein